MNAVIRSGRYAKLAAIGLALVILVSLSSCSAPVTSTAPKLSGVAQSTTIQPGVEIGDILIGGKTADAAKATLKNAVTQAYGKVTFRFVDVGGGGSFHYSLSDFGGYFDVDSAVKQAQQSPAGTCVSLPLKLNTHLVSLHLSRIADIWRIPVQEPKVRFTANGKTISAGHAGRTVDREAALNVVLSTLPTLSKPETVDDIPFIVSYPQVSPEQVDGLADTLVSYTTTFNPSNETRTNNLDLAVKNINGTVVGPGEVFSYNDSVGPRTQQTGFQDAIIYVDNRMKKDVGGGICQASSTLYNCVLLANMPIVERHAHSLPVHYVPPGRDATVAWGGDDFRFRNNTSKPVIVKATVTPGGTLTESLIGDRNSLPHPDANVAIDVTPRRPYDDGFAVNSYRVVKEDGVLIAKEPLGISVYHKLVGDVPH